MRVYKAAILILALPALVTCIFAQDVLEVNAKTIQQHVDHKVFPVYPPIATAARIQGTVVLDLRIGTTGGIESIKAISGPAMLQQAAIDCVKQWTFHPFEKDGVPVIATGQYNIIFALGDQSNTTIGQGPPSSTPSASSAPVKTVTVHVLSENAANGPDEELNSKFNDVDGVCKKGVLSRQFNDETVSACKNAAEMAEKLPLDGNYVARRSAFIYAASAYGDVGDLKDALPWAAMAVETVKLGFDDNSGSSAAYSTKGTIEGYLGDFPAADNDLTTAEDFSRKGITWVEKEAPSLRSEYVRPFVRDLQFHAKVLQAMGRPGEAQKKLDEAASFTSPNQ
jgi:TonB family protein